MEDQETSTHTSIHIHGTKAPPAKLVDPADGEPAFATVQLGDTPVFVHSPEEAMAVAEAFRVVAGMLEPENRENGTNAQADG